MKRIFIPFFLFLLLFLFGCVNEPEFYDCCLKFNATIDGTCVLENGTQYTETNFCYYSTGEEYCFVYSDNPENPSCSSEESKSTPVNTCNITIDENKKDSTILIPICSELEITGCTRGNCVVLVCGDFSYLPQPSPSAASFTEGREPVGLKGKARNLYGVDCRFEKLTPLLSRAMQNSKGKLYALSYRLGVGETFDNYDVASRFLPATDADCKINDVGDKDRFLNYLFDSKGSCYYSGDILNLDGKWVCRDNSDIYSYSHHDCMVRCNYFIQSGGIKTTTACSREYSGQVGGTYFSKYHVCECTDCPSKGKYYFGTSQISAWDRCKADKLCYIVMSEAPESIPRVSLLVDTLFDDRTPWSEYESYFSCMGMERGLLADCYDAQYTVPWTNGYLISKLGQLETTPHSPSIGDTEYGYDVLLKGFYGYEGDPVEAWPGYTKGRDSSVPRKDTHMTVSGQLKPGFEYECLSGADCMSGACSWNDYERYTCTSYYKEFFTEAECGGCDFVGYEEGCNVQVCGIYECADTKCHCYYKHTEDTELTCEKTKDSGVAIDCKASMNNLGEILLESNGENSYYWKAWEKEGEDIYGYELTEETNVKGRSFVVRTEYKSFPVIAFYDTSGTKDAVDFNYYEWRSTSGEDYRIPLVAHPDRDAGEGISWSGFSNFFSVVHSNEGYPECDDFETYGLFPRAMQLGICDDEDEWEQEGDWLAFFPRFLWCVNNPFPEYSISGSPPSRVCTFGSASFENLKESVKCGEDYPMKYVWDYYYKEAVEEYGVLFDQVKWIGIEIKDGEECKDSYLWVYNNPFPAFFGAQVWDGDGLRITQYDEQLIGAVEKFLRDTTPVDDDGWANNELVEKYIDDMGCTQTTEAEYDYYMCEFPFIKGGPYAQTSAGELTTVSSGESSIGCDLFDDPEYFCVEHNDDMSCKAYSPWAIFIVPTEYDETLTKYRLGDCLLNGYQGLELYRFGWCEGCSYINLAREKVSLPEEGSIFACPTNKYSMYAWGNSNYYYYEENLYSDEYCVKWEEGEWGHYCVEWEGGGSRKIDLSTSEHSFLPICDVPQLGKPTNITGWLGLTSWSMGTPDTLYLRDKCKEYLERGVLPIIDITNWGLYEEFGIDPDTEEYAALCGDFCSNIRDYAGTTYTGNHADCIYGCSSPDGENLPESLKEEFEDSVPKAPYESIVKGIENQGPVGYVVADFNSGNTIDDDKKQRIIEASAKIKEICPRCLVGIQLFTTAGASTSQDPTGAEFYANGVANDVANIFENPGGKSCEVPGVSCNDALLDAVDFIEIKVYPSSSWGGTPEEFYEAHLGAGREILRLVGKPNILLLNGADEEPGKYTKYLSENAMNLVRTGNFGFVYEQWNEGDSSLVYRITGRGPYEVYKTDGGPLDYFYPASRLFAGFRFRTFTQKVGVSETCPCIPCNVFDDQKLCNGRFNGAEGGPNCNGYQQGSFVKWPENCYREDTCIYEPVHLSCDVTYEDGTITKVEVEITQENIDLYADYVGSIEGEYHTIPCSLDDYSFKTMPSDLYIPEAILFPFDGSDRADCGNINIDPEICGFEMPTSKRTVSCQCLDCPEAPKVCGSSELTVFCNGEQLCVTCPKDYQWNPDEYMCVISPEDSQGYSWDEEVCAWVDTEHNCPQGYLWSSDTYECVDAYRCGVHRLPIYSFFDTSRNYCNSFTCKSLSSRIDDESNFAGICCMQIDGSCPPIYTYSKDDCTSISQYHKFDSADYKCLLFCPGGSEPEYDGSLGYHTCSGEIPSFCDEGYVYEDGECVDAFGCIDNEYYVFTTGECKGCAGSGIPAQLLESGAVRCVPPCDGGEGYIEDQSCKPCEVNFLDNAVECEITGEYTYIAGSPSKCLISCSDYSEPEYNPALGRYVCGEIVCPQGQELDPDTGQCTTSAEECGEGQEFNPDTGQCESICGLEEEWNSETQTCVLSGEACGHGAYWDAGLEGCICYFGEYSEEESTCILDNGCNFGEVKVGVECITSGTVCPSNEGWVEETQECVDVLTYCGEGNSWYEVIQECLVPSDECIGDTLWSEKLGQCIQMSKIVTPGT